MPARRKPLPEGLAEGPFRRAAALEAGVTRRRLQGPTVSRVFRGVYVSGEESVDLRTRVSAARMVLPADAVAIGSTALR